MFPCFTFSQKLTPFFPSVLSRIQVLYWEVGTPNFFFVFFEASPVKGHVMPDDKCFTHCLNHLMSHELVTEQFTFKHFCLRIGRRFSLKTLLSSYSAIIVWTHSWVTKSSNLKFFFCGRSIRHRHSTPLQLHVSKTDGTTRSGLFVE